MAVAAFLISFAVVYSIFKPQRTPAQKASNRMWWGLAFIACVIWLIVTAIYS